jgi:hypothetical protein
MSAAPPTYQPADLWQHIFGDQTGLIATFSGKRKPGEQELKDERSRYFKWPGEAHAAEQWLRAESDRSRCAYVCAHLINEPTAEEKAQGIKPRRVKVNAAPMLALYVDGDGASIPTTLPRPTAIVQSSPGRDQAYWRLTRAIDPARGEQLNKRLAYAMGADTSGWDLTQLLRAPDTRNHKYEDRPIVRVDSIEDRAYDPDELDRILPPLPDDKPERPAIKIERSTTLPSDRDRRALERMRASKRGAEIALLEAGGSKFSKPDGSPDGNRDDLSMLSAYAFWLDKDPARMARAAEQTARVRPKWYERHYANGETYLEHTIGEAIAGCRQTFRELTTCDAGDEVLQLRVPAPDEPATAEAGEPTTLEEALAEVRRLQRALLDRDDCIERMAGIIEDQMQVIAATRAERDRERELRARDRRMALAEQRLDRVSQYSVGQKAAIKASAQIAPALANTHRTDEPIMTREMVGAAYGAKPDTAGDHLKVFDVEGSPIRRAPKPYGTKTLYHFKLETLDPVEIVERMAALGERLEKRPTATKTPRCQDHPEAGRIVNIICAECGQLLDERHVKPRKAKRADNVEKNSTLGQTVFTCVDVPGNYGGEKRHVAGSEPDPDARAAAMVGASAGVDRPVDQWKRLEARTNGHNSHNGHGWLSQWDAQPSPFDPIDDGPEDPVLDPPRCIRPGCPEPCGPGDKLLCVEHRGEANAASPPAAAGGGEA